MSADHPVVRKSIVLTPAKCQCGEYLRPELIDITAMGHSPEWVLSWRCQFEMQHDWKAANES